MKTIKAGCILVNLETKQIALVCRDGSYSFPKGHMESGETKQECAVRETVEETGHKCHLISQKEIAIINYVTPRGEDVKNYFYVAIQDGIVDTKIDEIHTEETHWVAFDEVETRLSHENLIQLWKEIKLEIENIMNNI